MQMPAQSPSKSPRTEHAFTSDKSRNPAIHWTLAEVCIKGPRPEPKQGPKGPSIASKGTSQGQIFASSNVQESGVSSHARANVRAPAKYRGLSMPSLGTIPHILQFTAFGSRTSSRAKTQAFLYYRQHHTSCNVQDSKGSSHRKAQAPSSIRAAGASTRPAPRVQPKLMVLSSP